MLSLLPSSLLGSILMRPMFAQDVDYSARYSSTGHVSPVFWVIEVAFVILMVASMWKMFVKARQPGWASIIPIYNWIVLCKIVGRPGWWVLLLLVCFPIFYIILCVDLAKSFGYGVGYALGLVFLPIIFFPMLGFGSAQYKGPSAGTTTTA